MRKLLYACVSIAFLVGPACSSPQTADDETATESASEAEPSEADEAADATWDGHERLGDAVVPESYELDFEVDPSTETFAGSTQIEVSVEEKVERVRMHAERLEFSEVRAKRDGEKRNVDYEKVENGGLVLRFEESLEPGALTLSFDYEGPLDDVPEGLYRVEDGGSWYAFTQLEPLEAREMYPCFDEPKFKTPFSVQITVPKGMMAAANAPETDREELGDGEMVRYEFAETEPLPSYLVAIAVGNFDVVESSEVVEESERLDVPVRVLTTEGQGDLGAYALRNTPALVRFQEKYFGIDFPYQKMDLVAVPNFAAGAMENVGLVTFRESLLLIDEESSSLQDEYWAQAVMAHEYAHMWFGNLVTLEWWDELWLNEAFATWMASRTVQEVSPELEPEVQAIQRRSGVIQADSLKKSRAIRQPIEDGGDVYNAFDDITYNKGAAILRMFEAWVGREAFRGGVRSFLDANRHGTGRTDDLLAALSEASGESVGETIANFLNQPGAPLVTVGYDRSRCEEEGEATLELEQTRYRPVGSRAEVGEPWKIPMCVRYGLGEGETGKECVLFDGSEEEARTETVALETDTCPTWVHPNASESGYFHWKVEPREMQTRLVENRGKLELGERVALLGHLEAQVRTDALDPGVYLDAMETMSDASHRSIVQQMIGSLSSFEEKVYRGDPPQGFHEFVGELLSDHYRRIGFEPKEGDSPGDRLLRADLVEAMASLAADEDVRSRAVEFTETFLDEPESVSGRVAKYALDLAAKKGDAELWKKIREAAKHPPSPDLRAELLGALGKFESPELARKSLDLFLTDEIRSQFFWTLVGPVSGDPKTVDIAWKWMTDNYDAIVEKIGESHGGRLPWVGSAYCSKEGKKRVKSFFSKEKHQTVSTDRNLAKTLQSINQCAAYRELVGEDVRAYFGE